MISKTVVVNPIEPSPLSIRAALGADLDLEINFLSMGADEVDPTTLLPQLVLLPRSMGGVYAYDVEAVTKGLGAAAVTVPGAGLTDVSGYTLELYQRRAAEAPGDPPVPVGLLAKGVLRLEGSGYMRMGPLGMIAVPVVVGPQGVQGDPGETGPIGAPGTPGVRGSVWTTGTGAPTSTDALEGDMYLDNSTGNVWRWNGAAWMLGTF